MHHLLYISRATAPLMAPELLTLLRQSQAANSQAGITGILVYNNGRFLQLLEGQQEAVLATYDRILRDPRHRGVHRLVDKPIAERSFTSWSMAFQEVEAETFDHLVGYLPPEQLATTLGAAHPADGVLGRPYAFWRYLPNRFNSLLGASRRVALYVRVSTRDNGQNPQNQLVLLHREVKRAAYTAVQEYIDQESGGKASCRQFQLLMQAIKKGHFDLVRVFALDHFRSEGVEVYEPRIR